MPERVMNLPTNKGWLIYGGSNTGLMEAVARSAKENGAMIMGVEKSQNTKS